MNIQDTVIPVYSPDLAFLECRVQLGARLAREDCAIVDTAQDFLILASRGNLIPRTRLTEALGMTDEECSALTEAICTDTRFLTTAGERPMLVFADWITSTGLILVVLPHSGYLPLQKALGSIQREDIRILSPSVGRTPYRQCREALEMLDEILHYTDLILSKSISPHHLCLAAAMFAGCHLASGHSFADYSHLPTPNDRNVAFLLCSLLHISALNTTAHESFDHRFRLRLSYQRGTRPQASQSPAFLEAACFASFSFSVIDGGYLLSATDDSQVSLRDGDGQPMLFVFVCSEDEPASQK